MSDPALFLTVAETAETLGISDDTVYELTARGDLPCATFGRRKMIPRRAVELVIDRAMEGFDPDALIIRLAGSTTLAAVR